MQTRHKLFPQKGQDRRTTVAAELAVPRTCPKTRNQTPHTSLQNHCKLMPTAQQCSPVQGKRTPHRIHLTATAGGAVAALMGVSPLMTRGPAHPPGRLTLCCNSAPIPDLVYTSHPAYTRTPSQTRRALTPGPAQRRSALRCILSSTSCPHVPLMPSLPPHNRSTDPGSRHPPCRPVRHPAVLQRTRRQQSGPPRMICMRLQHWLPGDRQETARGGARHAAGRLHPGRGASATSAALQHRRCPVSPPTCSRQQRSCSVAAPAPLIHLHLTCGRSDP